MANKEEYVELGLACAEVCGALDRGMSGRELGDLSQPVFSKAIENLAKNMAEIQARIVEKRERNLLSRVVHARSDKEAIASWKADFTRILQIFNTEFVLDTHKMVSDVKQSLLKGDGGSSSQNQAAQSRVPGESPPSPPRVFFGRGELVEKIVSLVGSMTRVLQKTPKLHTGCF